MTPTIRDGITTVDTGLTDTDDLAAAFLLSYGGHAAFIDCGTALALPRMLDALSQQGLTPEQVDYVIPTHVHLDHAGGAGVLMQQLPNAQLVIHPYGARHMIDPSKLIGGATAVYGEETMARNFGEIVAIDAERVIEAEDNQVIDLGGHRLRLLDTPGHARHHLCVVDEQARAIFTGDTFGISYRAFDTSRGAFVFPAATPVQFDPEAMHRSIDRLAAEQPSHYYLTHFGKLAATAKLTQDLHCRVDGLVTIAEAAEPITNGRVEHIRAQMLSYLIDELRAHDCPLSSQRIAEVMAMDLDLDAQGLEVWLQRRNSH